MLFCYTYGKGLIKINFWKFFFYQKYLYLIIFYSIQGSFDYEIAFICYRNSRADELIGQREGQKPQMLSKIISFSLFSGRPDSYLS